MGNRAIATAFTTLMLLQTVAVGAQSSVGPPARRALVVAVSVGYFGASPSGPEGFWNSPGLRLAKEVRANHDDKHWDAMPVILDRLSEFGLRAPPDWKPPSWSSRDRSFVTQRCPGPRTPECARHCCT